MSKYKTISTEFRNVESLRKALDDLGYHRDHVMVAADPRQNSLPLYGYQGDRRPESAAVRIDRHGISRLSNDVGFAWNGQGYSLIVSDFDSGGYFSGQRTQALMQRYAYHEVVRKARQQGYQVKETTLADGTIQLQLQHY